MLSTHYSQSEAEAIAAWNRRAQPERKLTDAHAQEPDAWTWDTLIPNTNYHSAHFGFTKPEADGRILNLTPLYAGAPDQPAIAVAIKYPEEWDTAAYPTLESALHELQAWHKVCKEQEAETLAAQPASNSVIRDFRTTAELSNSVVKDSFTTADQVNGAIKKVNDDHAGDANEMMPDDSRDWARLDGTAAYHLIERHADNWSDAGWMMNAWLQAKIAAQPAASWSLDLSKCQMAPLQSAVAPAIVAQPAAATVPDAVRVIQELIDSHKRDVGGQCDDDCDIVAGMEAARDAVIASKAAQAQDGGEKQ